MSRPIYFAFALVVMVGSSACYEGRPLATEGEGTGETTDAETFGEGGATTSAGDGDGDGDGDGTGDGDGDGDDSGDGDGDTSGDGDGDGTGDGDGDTSGDGDGDRCANGPLPAPIPNCTPTPVPDSGDFHQDCVDRINQFRWECQCLPPLDRWVQGEACTNQQSADDQGANAPHGAFGACGEFAQNTCPNYNSEDHILGSCLQQMWDEGPGEPFSEHGHYINMSSTNYTRVACGSSASGNGVWSNQNFSN